MENIECGGTVNTLVRTKKRSEGEQTKEEADEKGRTEKGGKSGERVWGKNQAKAGEEGRKESPPFRFFSDLFPPIP